MTPDEFEAETIRRALDGDADSARVALDLCRSALDAGTMSKGLAGYLSDRLWAIDQALTDAEKLREIKTSSGAIQSSRDAAVVEALGLNRQKTGRPKDPFPAWKRPYAAFGTLLLKAGLGPERVKAAMDEVRQQLEGPGHGWDRRDAGQLLKDYMPMRELDDDMLLHLAGPLGEKLPTFLPQQLKP
ncbi:hypothetical protein [Roseateles sp. P5_E4]